jgi:hypothetical protein
MYGSRVVSVRDVSGDVILPRAGEAARWEPARYRRRIPSSNLVAGPVAGIVKNNAARVTWRSFIVGIGGLRLLERVTEVRPDGLPNRKDSKGGRRDMRLPAT